MRQRDEDEHRHGRLRGRQHVAGRPSVVVGGETEARARRAFRGARRAALGGDVGEGRDAQRRGKFRRTRDTPRKALQPVEPRGEVEPGPHRGIAGLGVTLRRVEGAATVAQQRGVVADRLEAEAEDRGERLGKRRLVDETRRDQFLVGAGAVPLGEPAGRIEAFGVEAEPHQGFGDRGGEGRQASVGEGKGVLGERGR